VSRYRRTQTDVVDAIRVGFNTPREELRAFDKRVMVSPYWDEFDQWIMLPSGEREFCFGDWIVKNEAGRLFFCDAETFAADYAEDTLAPYIKVMDAWAQAMALATKTPFDSDVWHDPAPLIAVTKPFDIRKDIYLGGIV